MSNNQQIIISGLGGQGVLFITKLLASAAMADNLPVLTSETHGMAQRGGNVISYLKIGDFSGPLIRPATADVLIALKAESFAHHCYFLKPGGLAVVNSPGPVVDERYNVFSGDAAALADKAGDARNENVAMLGFFLGAMENESRLFSPDSLARMIKDKFRAKPAVAANVLSLLESGMQLYNKR
ncbi:2-oxoacid:acceptor oxidoreductase family protein [uncultured Desulfobacter sp.]|uniref:2-oxoacid:acceptor oxidoreductase family protein n=1 Tax=uncultured Desulfobacter sp. TaxID=240139 RepID=UPI002AAA6F53|nr:2-oxoacid:acceptor oxidoreductase family protein [uncultured Desulfobacter sp.]